MDQQTWFAGFDVVPRAVLLLVSQAPDARHHGRLGTTGQCEGSQVQFLDKVFLHSRCCATCVLVQTVFYTVAFPQLQFFTVFVVASRCVPFHCRQARVAKRHALLGPFPGSEVLGQVVLARRCATPGAVSIRAVRSVARGDTTGAVLGRGLGHYDRCRGLDSLDRRLLIGALRQFLLSW